jgi:isoquinoline 1-oxidoreductase beta subunit
MPAGTEFAFGYSSNLSVLNAVAERIGWGKPAPQGVYRGLAHK